MKIELHEIPVREVSDGYKDSDENGVTGYKGRLNIRPAFQREFIYKDKQRVCKLKEQGYSCLQISEMFGITLDKVYDYFPTNKYKLENKE